MSKIQTQRVQCLPSRTIKKIKKIFSRTLSPWKKITLCKVLAHKLIKGNKKADKAAKQITDMPGMTMTRLSYTGYYLTIRKARNFKWQREWKNSTSKLYYIKPCIEEWENSHNSCRQYKVKLSRVRIGHTRLTYRNLVSKNNQKPTCGNQRLIIKPCLQNCPQWRDSRKKYNMQSDIKTLMGKDCEVKSIMRFLKRIGMFEEIYRQWLA